MNFRVTRPLMEGDPVRLIQHRLRYFGEGAGGTDGFYGSGTARAVRTIQRRFGLPQTGEVDEPMAEAMGLELFGPLGGDGSRYLTLPDDLVVPPEGFDFLVFHETGGQSLYDREFARPIWPVPRDSSEFSGVTIGCGYDLGQYDRDTFLADWAAVLPAAHVERLLPMVGVRANHPDAGSNYAELGDFVDRNADIVVDWTTSMRVFLATSLPVHAARALAAFPGLDHLPPRCRAALVSLVYNRGDGMEGDRRREMRDIRDAIARGDAASVPGHLRAMRRLWRSGGLRRRREEEAELFEWGLAAGA